MAKDQSMGLVILFCIIAILVAVIVGQSHASAQPSQCEKLRQRAQTYMRHHPDDFVMLVAFDKVAIALGCHGA